MAHIEAVMSAERPVDQERPERQSGNVLAAVTATFAVYLVVFPTVAAIATILAFLNPPELVTVLSPGPRALLIGVVAALVVGLVVAVLCHRLATPQGANSAVYGKLFNQLTLLDAQLDVIRPPADPSSGDGQIKALAYQEAHRQRDILERELTAGSAGLPWLLGNGYTGLWSRLHRAQEALVQVLPVEVVIASALYDDARLSGCDVSLTNADALRSQLREAASQLDPAVSRYFDGCPCGSGTSGATAKGTPAGSQPTIHPWPGVAPAKAPAAAPNPIQARAILRHVTHAINDYRDEQWEGLLRIRNRLLATVLLAGLVTYILLGLAVVMAGDTSAPTTADANGATIAADANGTSATTVANGTSSTAKNPKTPIMAGVAFYLVGALVGLFNRLRSEADSDSAVEDYGLALARLVHTPLFSGLAAVSGVLLTAILAGFSGVATATPTDTSVSLLPTIFKINPGSLLLAALFGLTPGLLIDRLGQAKALTDNIKATGAPNQTAAPASS